MYLTLAYFAVASVIPEPRTCARRHMTRTTHPRYTHDLLRWGYCGDRLQEMRQHGPSDLDTLDQLDRWNSITPQLSITACASFLSMRNGKSRSERPVSHFHSLPLPDLFSLKLCTKLADGILNDGELTLY